MTRFRKALVGAMLALAFLPAPAVATGIVPLSGTQQFDVASSPPAFLTGGRVYFYLPGTTTCAPVYTDLALTTLHPCPVILNSAGRMPAAFAADGSVRIRILNSLNVLQYDEDNVAIVTAAATSGGSTPIPDSTQIFGTRDIKVRFDDQPVSGFVRLNGRTIGSATSGASERANADTQDLFLELWGFANVSVSGGKGATAAADWSANKQLVLPDMAGRLLGGVDDMGAGARSRITSTTCTGPTVVGAACGTETKTVAQANLPNVAFTVSGITLTNGTPGVAVYNAASAAGSTSIQGAGNAGPTTMSAGSAAAAIQTNVSVATQGTAASGGSGTPLSSMPPVMLLTFYIRL